ncbi:MAG: NAD-dependent epimerase/dehydratase family protein [bacterium]|nr:NAD-dependent epimerase/dehydratase family protein [bacterium]
MRIIVTGATGFIGTALVEELLLNGHSVTAVIRPNSDKIQKLTTITQHHPNTEKRLQIVEVALEELEKLHTEYDIKADVWYHLAWNGSGGDARNDFAIQYLNVGYFADAIRTAKSCGCIKVIGAGSQAEYGVVHGLAVEDQTVPRPFMMYGAAKLAAYQMGQVLAKQIGIQLVWPRIYSVYGVGENSGTLVSYVIETLKKGEEPQLSPCENMWNFLNIMDCVSMIRKLGESKEAEGIYHVASEDTRLLKDFVTEIRDIIAPDLTLGFGAKQSDPSRTFWLEPSVEKIKKLGAFPEQTVEFAEGIRRRM